MEVAEKIRLRLKQRWRICGLATGVWSLGYHDDEPNLSATVLVWNFFAFTRLFCISDRTTGVGAAKVLVGRVASNGIAGPEDLHSAATAKERIPA